MVKAPSTTPDSSKVQTDSIHIGQIIEAELRCQGRTVTWLSRKIHCDRRNIYDIFKRDSIDTQLLYRLCIAFNVNFFELFSRKLDKSLRELSQQLQDRSGNAVIK